MVRVQPVSDKVYIHAWVVQLSGLVTKNHNTLGKTDVWNEQVHSWSCLK